MFSVVTCLVAYLSFTCSSRDDSLGVKVSEEKAVDQCGFSKSRFTFGQEKKIQESITKAVVQILVPGCIQTLHV